MIIKVISQWSFFFCNVRFHWKSHLIAEKFVQFSQLVGVGDLTLQRRVALQRTRGPADSNGRVSADPLGFLGRPVVGLWSVVGQGECCQMRGDGTLMFQS